jgi:hypothetical protein
MDPVRPKGFPIAATSSPIESIEEFPMGSGINPLFTPCVVSCSSLVTTLSTAISENMSAPTTSAVFIVPFENVTVTLLPPYMT